MFIQSITLQSTCSHLLHGLRLRRNITKLATVLARPFRLIIPERVHGLLNLSAQIGADESGLVHLVATVLAVPSQPVQTAFGSRLLKHDTDRVGEAHWIVRRVGRQEKHLTLVDVDVSEFTIVHRLQQHATLVLEEELGRLVDVVVGASVGSAYYHYGHGIMMDAVVVDWRFE